MSRTARALVGFIFAPAIPGTLLYLYALSKGYGNEAVVGPVIFTFLGYIAELLIGVPVYFLLQRKGVRSLRAYALAGALIGAAFYLLFEIVTDYPGQLMIRLRQSLSPVLVAATFASLSAVSFWLIACMPITRSSTVD